MAIIETTRNEKGEFVAKHVRQDSLQGMYGDLLEELRKGLARLTLLALVLASVLLAGFTVWLYPEILQVFGQ